MLHDVLGGHLLWIVGIAISTAVAFAVTPLVRRFAKVIGAIDVPLDDRRMHKVPVPRLGGLAIFIGFITAVLLLAELNMMMRGMLIGAVIIIVLGCVDDVARLHWSIKLLVQVIAALIVVLHGVQIETFGNPLYFWFGPEHIKLSMLSLPISVIWIVAITNSVNFIDGLDGLACGVSLIGSVSMLIIALVSGTPEVVLIMAALSGACLGFLPYNKNPAKLFMGDTGATFLGFVLASASIQGLFKMYTIISFAVPFLVLGLPIFDILASVVRRLLKGQNPAHADRSHIHHRLIDMGFSQKQAVMILYAVSAVLGITAVVLATGGEARALVLLAAVILAVLTGLRILHVRSTASSETLDSPESPPESPPQTAAAEDNAQPSATATEERDEP